MAGKHVTNDRQGDDRCQDRQCDATLPPPGSARDDVPSKSPVQVLEPGSVRWKDRDRDVRFPKNLIALTPYVRIRIKHANVHMRDLAFNYSMRAGHLGVISARTGLKSRIEGGSIQIDVGQLAFEQRVFSMLAWRQFPSICTAQNLVTPYENSSHEGLRFLAFGVALLRLGDREVHVTVIAAAIIHETRTIGWWHRSRSSRAAEKATISQEWASRSKTMGLLYSSFSLTNDPSERRSPPLAAPRSEEHTSELQSRENLVCRLLLEKKKKKKIGKNLEKKKKKKKKK